MAVLMAKLDVRASNYPRKFVCTTRKPILNLTLSSYFGSLQPDIAHPCIGQLTAVKTGYPLSSIS